MVRQDTLPNLSSFLMLDGRIDRELANIGVQINTLNVENIYNESLQSTSSINVWLSAPTIAAARPKVVQVSSVCIKQYR